MSNNIQLSDHFSTGKLLRLTLPTIMVMIVSSVYMIADGLFIANFIGSTAYAAQNIIGNFLFFLIAVGVMFGSGGSALVSKTLGEGKKELANREFSMMIWTALGIGLLLMAVSLIIIRPMSELLGAEGLLLEDSVIYGSIAVLSLPGAILQGAFQYFFTTAEKPVLGMLIGFGTSILNIVLDALFIIVFQWGIAGAAKATAISMLLAGIIPLCYFLRRNSSILRLRPVGLELDPIGKSCLNGLSELLSTISVAIVGILYNFQLLHYIGEDGVAAYGAITMASTIFTCCFTGYGMGVTPVIGYHFGAKNNKELQNVFRLTCMLVGVASLVIIAGCYFSANLFASFYFSSNSDLMTLSAHGLRIFAISFLFIGFNIFGSTLFTALNNGIISGVLSTLRTLVFQVIFILLLPALLGTDGIWWAVVPAELCSLIAVILFTIAKREKYHYY